MKKLLFTAAAVCLMSAPAFANEAKDKGDGCGLGWQVTQERTFLATTTRQSTNAFVPPTFGMTSGTIGCEQHDIAKNEVESAEFAVTNLDSLNIEMAQGQGENLHAFARTFGCDDAVLPVFGGMTQEKYESLSTSASGLELAGRVKASIQANPVLAASCGSV